MAKGATHVLGLDIGNSTIKLVELALGRSGVQLVTEPVVVVTPPGSVAGGVITDGTAVSEVIHSLVTEYRCKTKKTVASVGGDTSVVARVISMPRMTGKELEEAMQWELDRQTPFPVDQVIYDFAPLPTPEGAPEGENMEVFLAVGQEDMINAHVQALQTAKLVPLHIDVEPLALARALIGLPDDKYREQTAIIIDCGATFTGIYIFRQGWPAFLRTVPTAGEAMTEAIREETGASPEMAEQAKRQFANVAAMGGEGGSSVAPESGVFDSAYEEGSESAGTGPVLPDLETLPATDVEVETEPEPAPGAAASAAAEAAATAGAPGGPAPADLPPEIVSAREIVAEAISQRVYDLVTEIGRSMDFYRRQHRDERLTEIMLVGGSAHLPGLPELIAAETGLPTRIANPFDHISADGITTPEYLRDVGPTMAVAVGLALRDMVE
ncbi:MAG: type IV pilus assembly protein PilM [candidate division WS1 bacterium]|nr:type IV pilus assembly protein PilM [candidate division WS1 bacterium]